MAIDTGFKTQISEAIKSLTEAQMLKIGNAIYQGFLEVGSFGDRHRVLDGYRDGVKVPIIKSGDYYGSLSAAKACDTNTCDIDNEYSTKKWRIGDYACRLALCIDDLDESFRTFWGMYKQTLADPTQEPDKKEFIAFFIEQSQKHLRGTLWRVGYFGDVTATTNTLINQNNGLWTEADAGSGHKVTLTLTDGKLTGEQLYAYFEQAYLYAMEQPWFNESQFKFRVSRKTARTFVAWLNSIKDHSQYNCECINADAVTSRRLFAVDNIAVFGIPIISHEEEQHAEFELTGKNEYRILLVRDENALFAVETRKHLEQFDFFYDKKDKKIYIDLGAQLGSAIPLDEYVYMSEAPGE